MKISEKEKLTIIAEETKTVLRVIRDIKALAKGTKKTRLTKIIKHTALLVDLYTDLLKNLKEECMSLDNPMTKLLLKSKEEIYQNN